MNNERQLQDVPDEANQSIKRESIMCFFIFVNNICNKIHVFIQQIKYDLMLNLTKKSVMYLIFENLNKRH